MQAEQWSSVQRVLQVCVPIAGCIALLAFWSLAISYFQIPRYVLPSPSQTWNAIVSDWPSLWRDFITTFGEFAIGFCVGSIAGFVLAVTMDQSGLIRSALYPILIASQAVPIIAISAALTIWLGFGLAPKIVIVALTVFFPVIVNVLDGLASVDTDMLNLARSMGGTRMNVFRHIKLPATYTPLFSGLKLSATFSVTGAVIGEWTASTSGGLGAYLLQANSRLNTAGTFAAIALLAALGMLSFLCVVVLEWILTPWRSSSKARRWLPNYWHGKVRTVRILINSADR